MHNLRHKLNEILLNYRLKVKKSKQHKYWQLAKENYCFFSPKVSLANSKSKWWTWCIKCSEKHFLKISIILKTKLINVHRSTHTYTFIFFKKVLLMYVLCEYKCTGPQGKYGVRGQVWGVVSFFPLWVLGLQFRQSDFQDRHFYPVSNPGSPEVIYLL